MRLFGLEEHEKGTNLHEYNHALFQNMMYFLDIVWEINMQTGTVVALEDRTAPEINGREYAYDRFYQDCLASRIAPEDCDTFRRYMAPEHLHAVKDEEKLHLNIRTVGGRWELYQVALTPTLNEDGTLDCVYFCAQNIQDKVASRHSQKQLKEALLAGSYFHFTFTLSDGMIHEDAAAIDGRHLMTEATGLPVPMPYDTWANAWYEQYRPEFLETESKERIYSTERMREAFQNGERVIDVLLRQTLPWSGEQEIVQISTILLEDPLTGDGTAWIIWRKLGKLRQSDIAHNMELKATNEHLSRTISQEEQFRQATLSGSLMVYNINLTRDLIEDEFYEIVDGQRYPMLEMVGLSAPCSFDEFCRRWSVAKVPGDSRESFLRQYNRRYCLDAYERGERVLEIEFDTRIGRGISVTMRSTVLMMRDESTGDIIANVSGRDVSEQRKEERLQREALRRAYESATAANAAKSDFLARMSHDIRTPMNAIVGMTAIARAHMDDATRVDDCLEKITVASDHLLNLINEVLDMSAIEAGRIELQEEVFTLPEFVETVLEICGPHIEAKHHTLDVSIQDIQHERVIGDEQRLRQAVVNLVNNAIKYTPDGGNIRLAVTEKATNRPSIGCFELVIEDNGIGISEDSLGHIFEPFVRSSDERSLKKQGTGLGLSITKSIIEMMSGYIEVESELNKGTKFTVTFFLKLQPEDDSSAASNDAAEHRKRSTLDSLTESDFSGHRVLLVEDNELNAEIAIEILGMTGLEIEHVSNGREALDRMSAVEDGYYDLIFMDIQMPVMNGHEAAHAIRALGREYTDSVPIVAMSANAFAQDVQESRMSGMNAHIAKPIDFEHIKCVLSEWIPG